MLIDRRDFLTWMRAAAICTVSGKVAANERSSLLYGLIGKILAIDGKREELAEILIEGVSGMPGCLSYVVAKDSTDADALWVTEVWENKEKHAASLSLPSVQEAISKGRPIIAGFDERFETIPMGGHGIQQLA